MEASLQRGLDKYQTSFELQTWIREVLEEPVYLTASQDIYF